MMLILRGRLSVAAKCAVSVVVWITGEENRRLHLLCAREELDLQVSRSESIGDPSYLPLNRAIRAAAGGGPHAQPRSGSAHPLRHHQLGILPGRHRTHPLPSHGQPMIIA